MHNLKWILNTIYKSKRKSTYRRRSKGGCTIRHDVRSVVHHHSIRPPYLRLLSSLDIQTRTAECSKGLAGITRFAISFLTLSLSLLFFECFDVLCFIIPLQNDSKDYYPYFIWGRLKSKDFAVLSKTRR